MLIHSIMTGAASLQDIVLDPFSAGIGLAAGVLICGLALGFRMARLAKENAALEARLETERAALGDHFRSLAQNALQSNNEQFLALAAERLKAAQERGANDLDKRTIEIEKMVKPIEKELARLNALSEQIQGTDRALRADLQNLHKETAKLTTALRNPAAQGKWGEFILETILEKAHLKKGTHYETQTGIESGGRPDVIINLHDGFRIAIDSKAPINEFIQRMDDDLSDDEFKAIKANMASTVRGHVKKLGDRAYQESMKGCDFVILFLPSEAVFSATLNADPSIVDFASDKNVVIASPTLIISLLRVVGLSWRQVEMAKNAADIAALGDDLHKRFLTFLDHFQKIGKGLAGAVQCYDKALGSMNRMVLPAARKFQKINANNKGAANLPDLPALESAAHLLSAGDEEIAEEGENDIKRLHG
jgi:DNA recombination protein RmuC